MVENAHFDSLKTALKPEIYLANRVGFRVLGVRYGEGINPAAPMVDLERLWRTLIPEVPFLYQRLDGVLADQYAREHVQATLLMVFSGVAVLVACLGLFGVSVFIATRRTREVAVRKILAPAFSRSSSCWSGKPRSLLAALIAGPVTVYILRGWLAQSRHHLDLSVAGPAVCIAAVVLALALSWITVGGHALCAARSRMINVLRHE